MSRIRNPVKGASPVQITAEFARDLPRDIVQTAGIEHVQGFELALWVPPFGGHRLELGNLGGINCGLTGLHSALHVLFYSIRYIGSSWTNSRAKKAQSTIYIRQSIPSTSG
jgi:hypothetical protein